MEVVEHVEDLDFFYKSCSKLLNKNGLIFFATINKTIKSYLLAILGAEYVLRWLPIGTHDWKKFVKPSHMINSLSQIGLSHKDIIGVVFNPLINKWKLSKDLDVNYMSYFKETNCDFYLPTALNLPQYLLQLIPGFFLSSLIDASYIFFIIVDGSSLGCKIITYIFGIFFN